MQMAALVICNPSWDMTEIEGDISPSALGAELVELVKRDGAERVSDVLSSKASWTKLDRFASMQTSEEETLVEGYGFARPGVCDYSDEEHLAAYGIMTDGSVLYTDLEENDTYCIYPNSAVRADATSLV
ncbi:MAG: hypothetical protein BZ138_07630 [Methanosphaera sp. rholeuAM270]|nr:MAG: hypothetical protein BZ138_07630 [Methanosphaera sp. rholeuAM270]